MTDTEKIRNCGLIAMKSQVRTLAKHYPKDTVIRFTENAEIDADMKTQLINWINNGME